ncbi:MAG TPA: hypothetical protein DD640_01240 [Clostridiales bacterium]|nr:hypothetical protein [Clostridiales bacterium]
MLIPNLALIALAGQYEVGFKETPALFDRVKTQLRKLEWNIVAADAVIYDDASQAHALQVLNGKDLDALCVCVGTWSEDHYLLDLLEDIDLPVILWAFPAVETGSLCGAQQICCVLKELGRQYFFAYGHPEDPDVLREITPIVRAAALARRLRHTRIGTVGGRVKGMTEIAYDEFELKDKLGVRIVNLDENELTEAYSGTSCIAAAEYWQSLKTGTRRIAATDESGVESVRYYLAMKRLVREYQLEGLAIKCYPKWMGKVCLGYSLLAEEGIVCGCEGDVSNTVSMKILYELTGQPIHNTDLLYPDTAADTILFSHCGSGGFSLAASPEAIELSPVRLADQGVCVLFPARPGKVTLINLTGRKTTLRMSALVGDAVACGMEFPGNPLKVRFTRDIREINRQIAAEGIGHHWMGGYGNVFPEIAYLCKIIGVRLIDLQEP